MSRAPNPHPAGLARSSWWRHFLQHAQHWIFNYVTFHFLTFLIVALLAGIAVTFIEGMGYIDGLFMATSALTVTGLTIADMATTNLATQITLMVLMIIGSTTLVSVVPMLIRGAILRRHLRDENPRLFHIEQSAMYRLAVIVPIYMFANIGIGFLASGFYTQFTSKVKPTLQVAGVNPWYASLFISIASFADAGFTPFSNSLVGYDRSAFLLILYAYLILAGNTAFPILLRLLLRIRVWLSPCFKYGNEEYKYTIEHPRRVYTHLFPDRQTLSLLGILILLILIQSANLLIFDWNGVLKGLSPPLKGINAYFQSVSTRSAGFNTIDLVAESPPVQVMQVLMMYLSALPVALVIRSSTEEAWSPDIPPDLPAILPRRNRLTSLLRRALQRDLCVLVLAYYTVSAIERNRILSPDTTPSATPTPSTSQPITLFAILYELVSAYGTVGLSLSTTPESLSASLRPLSRLVITLVMLLGRHRGLGLLLPLQLDRALPRQEPPAHALPV